MRIEQAPPLPAPFSPITLTIETVEELVVLAAAIGCTSYRQRAAAAMEYYGITVKPAFDSAAEDELYSALKSKLEPYRGQTL